VVFERIFEKNGVIESSPNLPVAYIALPVSHIASKVVINKIDNQWMAIDCLEPLPLH
jgi:hypothetical protein